MVSYTKEVPKNAFSIVSIIKQLKERDAIELKLCSLSENTIKLKKELDFIGYMANLYKVDCVLDSEFAYNYLRNKGVNPYLTLTEDEMINFVRDNKNPRVRMANVYNSADLLKYLLINKVDTMFETNLYSDTSVLYNEKQTRLESLAVLHISLSNIEGRRQMYNITHQRI